MRRAFDAVDDGEVNEGRGGSWGGLQLHPDLAPTAGGSGEIPAGGGEIGEGEWSGRLSEERGGG